MGRHPAARRSASALARLQEGRGLETTSARGSSPRSVEDAAQPRGKAHLPWSERITIVRERGEPHRRPASARSGRPMRRRRPYAGARRNRRSLGPFAGERPEVVLHAQTRQRVDGRLAAWFSSRLAGSGAGHGTLGVAALQIESGSPARRGGRLNTRQNGSGSRPCARPCLHLARVVSSSLHGSCRRCRRQLVAFVSPPASGGARRQP